MRNNSGFFRVWLVRIVSLFYLWGISNEMTFAQSYVVSPGIPDFTDLTARCVVATYGTTTNPFQEQGIVSNRHQVITMQGTDIFTGDHLNFLPSGESQVVKLGNEYVDGEAESITYHFMVDRDRSVLLLKFAVVFVDPGHMPEYQPRFVVRIMDKDGNLIDACAEYDVSARPDIEGFQTNNYSGIPICWRDWTNVGLDMSALTGKEVQVQLVTYDCALMGHFGYAYFTASCVSHQLALKECGGNQFTIDAPLGFQSYLWQDGRTTPSTRWTQTGEDMNISCEITSATGCRFTLGARITSADQLPEEKELHDTICEGEAYKRYGYDLPEQREIGTFRYENTYFDPATCSDMGMTTLFLTVLPRYYPIEVELCPGESYIANGFNYDHPVSGEYRDTLWYSTTSRCDSVVVLHLIVYPAVEMTNDIVGDKQPCIGSAPSYSISEIWESGSYSWEFPDGYYVISGQGTSRVTVQVTDQAQAGNVNIHFGAAGCATGTEPFALDPKPVYRPELTDTICTGSEYRKQGFAVPAQNNPGVYIFRQYKTTMDGCDSIITLSLTVFETPVLHIQTSDTVICDGTVVKLAVENEKFKPFPFQAPSVVVGDILCEDGSIVKQKEYATSGKVAQGIVFWVDLSGEHGWAVHLYDQSIDCTWSSVYEDIPGLVTSNVYSVASMDTSGYDNTKAIREFGTASEYEAAYSVDFVNGWYIPAIGQLLQLYASIVEVNEGLKKVGGRMILFTDTDEWSYWSSTGVAKSAAWYMEIRGFEDGEVKTKAKKLRSIRSF